MVTRTRINITFTRTLRVLKFFLTVHHDLTIYYQPDALIIIDS